jgi:UDP-perosamine 4-acetyltransferase
VIELIRAAGDYNPVGLVAAAAASSEPVSKQVLGVPIIGTDGDLPRLRATGLAHAFVAIGDNEKRVAKGCELRQLGFDIVNAISPMAVISPSARLGRAIAIMAGAVVNAEAQIEDFAIINTRASIDHDCHIAEGVHVAPGCAIAGEVTIGRLSFLGAGASVIPRVRIGAAATIGAGACVLRDIPAGASAWGVPARVMRLRT